MRVEQIFNPWYYHFVENCDRDFAGFSFHFQLVFGKNEKTQLHLYRRGRTGTETICILLILYVFSAGKIPPFFFVSLDVSKFVAGKYIFSGSLRKFTSGITFKATSGEEKALGTSSSRVTENNCVCDVTMT